MQRKIVLFLIIAVVLNCNFYSLAESFPENKIISGMVGQGVGCTVVEAADTGNEENETIENLVADAIEEEKISEGSGQKQDSFENTAVDGSEQKMTENESPEKEVTNDVERDEIRLLEEEDRKEQEIIEEKKKEDCIYNVSFPVTSKVYLDPGNLSGKGQIFSEEFGVENYGNTDIAIKIKNINVFYYSTEEVYELSEQSVNADSYVKKINVDIVWKNKKENTETVLDVVEGAPNECVLSLEASEYDDNGQFTRLNEGSTGLFYFTGSLNSNPELVWEDGEVSVSFDYEIENMDKDEKTEDQIEQELSELQDVIEKQEEMEEQEELEIPRNPDTIGNLENQEKVKGQEEVKEQEGAEEKQEEQEKKGVPKEPEELQEPGNKEIQEATRQSLQQEDERIPVPETIDENEIN